MLETKEDEANKEEPIDAENKQTDRVSKPQSTKSLKSNKADELDIQKKLFEAGSTEKIEGPDPLVEDQHNKESPRSMENLPKPDLSIIQNLKSDENKLVIRQDTPLPGEIDDLSEEDAYMHRENIKSVFGKNKNNSTQDEHIANKIRPKVIFFHIKKRLVIISVLVFKRV